LESPAIPNNFGISNIFGIFSLFWKVWVFLEFSRIFLEFSWPFLVFFWHFWYFISNLSPGFFSILRFLPDPASVGIF